MGTPEEEIKAFDEKMAEIIHKVENPGGEVIDAGFRYLPASRVPGARSHDSKVADKLKEIDRTQAIGRITSRDYYID